MSRDFSRTVTAQLRHARFHNHALSAVRNVNVMKRIVIAGLLAASTVFAAEPGQTGKAGDQNADNTRKNAEQKLTAEDQGEAPQDRDLTQKIRSAIVKDDSLSASAKNVKVITRNGKVTLRGPVDSDQEKQTINSLASGLAGKENVSNQLDVKANQ